MRLVAVTWSGLKKRQESGLVVDEVINIPREGAAIQRDVFTVQDDIRAQSVCFNDRVKLHKECDVVQRRRGR